MIVAEFCLWIDIQVLCWVVRQNQWLKYNRFNLFRTTTSQKNYKKEKEMERIQRSNMDFVIYWQKWMEGWKTARSIDMLNK